MYRPARELARVTRAASRRLGRTGGTTAPGRLLLRLAPDGLRRMASELDDGQLDVLISKQASKLTFLRELPKVFKGAHLDSPHVEFLRGEVVEVRSDRPFVIYADGDPIGATPATVRVEQRCLRVVVPA